MSSPTSISDCVVKALGRQMDLAPVLAAPLRLVERGLLQVAASRIATAFLEGKRLWAIGNGGSHAQAAHFCAELAVRFRDDTPHWPAVALPTDVSAMTALTNDFDPAEAMERQVQAHVSADDVLVGFTTSNSANVMAALIAANEQSARSVLLTGPPPNATPHDCIVLNVMDDDGPDATTAQIQVAHLVMLHILADALDEWHLGLDTSA